MRISVDAHDAQGDDSARRPRNSRGGILVFSTLITEMSVTIIIYSARWKTISIAIFEQLVEDEVFTASAIGSVAIGLTLVLVFVASRLVGTTMAEMFR